MLYRHTSLEVLEGAVILIQKEKVIMRYQFLSPFSFCWGNHALYMMHTKKLYFNSPNCCWQIMHFCQSFMDELYRHLGPNQVKMMKQSFYTPLLIGVELT